MNAVAEKPYSPNRWQPLRLQPWHFAMMDEIIANPVVTSAELSAKIGVTVVAINLVRTADLFRYKMDERRKEISAAIDQKIKSKLSAVVENSIGALAAKVEARKDLMSTKELVEISKMGLEALGYGTPAAPAAAVQVNTTVAVPVSLKDLEVARANLRTVESAKIISGSGIIQQRQIENDNPDPYCE